MTALVENFQSNRFDVSIQKEHQNAIFDPFYTAYGSCNRINGYFIGRFDRFDNVMSAIRSEIVVFECVNNHIFDRSNK